MPDANMFAFTYPELITMMLKETDVHEGLWTISVQFNLTAGNLGPTPGAMNPTAILVIPAIGIQRVTEAPSGSSVVVDAAKANPATKASKIKK